MVAHGYVIHTRTFQENKVLIDLLTLEAGLLRTVYRVSKKEAQVLPGPFLRYELEIAGRGDLKTLKSIEGDGAAIKLEGLYLYSAMYVHEIIEKIVPLNLPLENMFVLYEWLAQSFEKQLPIAPLLRRFEAALFDEVGMSINMGMTATGQFLTPEQIYQFIPRFGLKPYHGEQLKRVPSLFVSGDLAAAYANGDWTNKKVLEMAKMLHRDWLLYLLHGRELNARKLLPVSEYAGEKIGSVPVFR
ncbi:DNA repair protein RecO [Marinomonas balearica]|uniref:DNA repair protein RecO n=1 Tax=Marinomonas balearica TaxID=491947 RepID=A0A4R6M4V8_9GAMM|nr:recombination protein O N-terminal domain-containing protein [Marinomonas balearica]TDO96358.1 DNA replication and repair protein RecO [Marinomonas balearica]